MGDTKRRGALRQMLRRWSQSTDDRDAAELQEETLNECCRDIGSVGDREEVTVHGRLKQVSLAPLAGTPTIEAVLFDGTDEVTLIWLGRRTIAGIKPGVHLTAWGRVSCQGRRKVVFNPEYELKASV